MGHMTMAQGTSDRVVVIDDDQAVLESFQFMLEVAGFRTVAYSSPLAFLREGGPSPCCMILDQHMPHMTGLELAASLRASGDQSRILLITADPTPTLEARAAECGVERVLAKPPPEHEILAFVRSCIER